MRVALIISFLLLTFHFAGAQINLVPNPSIEQTKEWDSDDWGYIDSLAAPWFNTTVSSPDLFMEFFNGLFPSLGAPQNGFGFQLHQKTFCNW